MRGALAALRHHTLAVAVFGICLASTALVAWQLDRVVAMKDEERFLGAADQLQDSIQRRIAAYTDMLRATAGMLDVEGPFDRRSFRAFVRRLEPQQRYPGILGLGFTARVPREQLPAVIARHRADMPGFRVWPGHPRDEYHVILYLEPLDERNRAAIGYDMFTDETRREAMARARDSGQPAASGPVSLVQEIDASARQPGFLIYLPVYTGGAVPPTVDERRARLRGFVYSPFRTGDLFAGILGTERQARAGFTLVDRAEPGRLLYRSNDVQHSEFSVTRTIDVSGRQWGVSFFSLPGLEHSSYSHLVPVVFWGGAAISLLVAALVAMQTRAQLRLESSEHRIAEAARQFEQLANSIPQLAWMAQPDGWIYWYNDRWYEYTGTTPDDMTGWGWQKVHDPDMLPRVMERWAASIRTGEPFEMEFPLRGRNGTFRWFLTRVEPLRDTRGRILQWFGTNTDIQALRDADARVQELLERERTARNEAERISRLKDEFLATLSHELRTPLNAIMGWSHLLQQGGVPPGGLDKALGTILRNVEAQSKLIDDLLDMSRIISGRLRIDTAPVMLPEIIEAAVGVVRPAADAKGVTISTHFEPAPVVIADAARLQQVFWNLLSNAVKFTPAGGHVTVTVRPDDRHVLAEVRDTGIGISKEFLPWVFDRFRQADPSALREHGGLGLGLSIVQSLVHLHGGTVEAQSDGPGHGATFTVRLPVAVGAAPTVPEHSSSIS